MTVSDKESPVPTLLLKDGFKFFFYANEHEPRHIHVTKGGSFAKINLVSMETVYSSMKRVELKKALMIAREHRGDFLRKWDEYFKR